MKTPPAGWPRISPCLFYDDAPAAIDWLCEAFGFEVRLKVEGEGGIIVHSELELAGGLIMLSTARKNDITKHCVSPRAVEGLNTQNLALHVDDADAHCERARKAGATISIEPETHDYGDDYWADRGYGAIDPEGHHWYFMQRLRTGRK